MNRLIKYIQYSCLGLALVLTSCIRDGLDECPPVEPSKYSSYIKFIYDYNMAFEDLFHRQVSKYDLYLFDENDVFVHRMVETCPAGSTFPRGYTVGILKEFKHATQFVVFAGVDETQENLPTMTAGVSKLNDLYLKLNDRENNIIDTNIPSLWHGKITNMRSRANNVTPAAEVLPNDTTVISLTKNTNTFRIVLQTLVDTIKVDAKDFEFNLSSVNGSYDAYNNPIDAIKWNYKPYVLENFGNEGAVAELNTLRLMSDRENRLTIRHKISDKDIVDINLNKYLSALKLAKYSKMSFDEYLDRECEYNIIIFLSPVDCPDCPANPECPTCPECPVDPECPECPVCPVTKAWVATQIQINQWVEREQGGDL